MIDKLSHWGPHRPLFYAIIHLNKQNNEDQTQVRERNSQEFKSKE